MSSTQSHLDGRSPRIGPVKPWLKAHQRQLTIFIGLAAALTFIVMTGIHLDYQGVYYDELHQAPTAFRYLGKHPTMFNREFNDIPILNMTYSGAIKSHIYGIYLRYIGHQFGIYSWRLLGILFVAAGLLAFYWIARRFLSAGTAALFALLVLTDLSVILTTRFDWGPTALALALRLVLVGVWLSLQFGERTNVKLFLIGLITGIAVFEKLVAVVLLGPLLAMMLDDRKMGRKGLLAIFGGGLLGTFPLFYANYSSYRHAYGFVSLSDVAGWKPLHLSDAIAFVYDFLALGQGTRASLIVFGSDLSRVSQHIEVGLMLLAVSIVGILSVRYGRSSKWMSVAGKMLVAYALVLVLLFLLPRGTYIHHWIQATPFQYAALAFAWNGFPDRRLLRAAFIGVVGILLLARVPNLVSVEVALAQGKSSQGFDRSFLRLGEIAKRESRTAAFVAADWGTATQIYCFSNGADDVVYETFWGGDPAYNAKAVLQATKKDTLYVVASGLVPEFDRAAKSALDAVTSSPGWKEVPIDDEMAQLLPIQVHKFVRSYSTAQ